MGEKIDSDLLKSYRTIDTSRIGQCPEKKKIWGFHLLLVRLERIFFKKKKLLAVALNRLNDIKNIS